MQSIKMWVGVGFRVIVAVFILNFLIFFFPCGLDYFSRFMGLICWRFRWRIGILNEFSHVYLLRKCNKRKENIDCFNFLGNYTCSSCSFPKNMLLCSFENNEKKKKLITIFNQIVFYFIYFLYFFTIKIEKLKKKI